MPNYGVNLATGVLASIVILTFLALGMFALSGGLGFRGGELVNAAERSIGPSRTGVDFM